MTVFNSKVNTNSDAFKKNRTDMLALVDKLQELNGRGAAISAKRKARFAARNQLLPRERLARLLDPGMPFLEIGNLAGYLFDTKEEAKSIPGSTVISGIGFINGTRCVIVVDDSGAQRRLLRLMLLRWGFEVAEAEDAEQGLALCQSFAPDLVISDWMMPGMTGVEFCLAFRALARDSYGYFILLTSKSEKAAVASGLESGADDFLTKPVNGIELRARINAGARILSMERELKAKNAVIADTLAELQSVHASIDKDLQQARILRDQWPVPDEALTTLATQRATTTKDFLLNEGIPAERLGVTASEEESTEKRFSGVELAITVD